MGATYPSWFNLPLQPPPPHYPKLWSSDCLQILKLLSSATLVNMMKIFETFPACYNNQSLEMPWIMKGAGGRGNLSQHVYLTPHPSFSSTDWPLILLLLLVSLKCINGQLSQNKHTKTHFLKFIELRWWGRRGGRYPSWFTLTPTQDFVAVSVYR